MKRAPRIAIAVGLGILLLAGLVAIVGQVDTYGSPMLAEANRHKILLLTVGSEPSALDPDLTEGFPRAKLKTQPERFRPRQGILEVTVFQSSLF